MKVGSKYNRVYINVRLSRAEQDALYCCAGFVLSVEPTLVCRETMHLNHHMPYLDTELINQRCTAKQKGDALSNPFWSKLKLNSVILSPIMMKSPRAENIIFISS